MYSKATPKADFSTIRYAQCWEDADILLEALDIQPGDVCLSIASAGDNTLAMLSKNPQKVIALDMSRAQLACLELRVAAYRSLSHPELLELVGSRPSRRRQTLYQCCRPHLTPAARAFWDGHAVEIGQGIGSVGKFERYFALFRTRILPLIHSRRRVEQLLHQKTARQRHQFYRRSWNTWRWNLLFRLFFSRFVMSRLGRDPSFFQYVEGRVADRILQRTHYALTTLDPVENPYLQWIMTGHHALALPYALRPENFEPIRANLDRLEWRQESVEAFLSRRNGYIIDRYNLSDIFEYMSPDHYQHLLAQLVAAGHHGTRLVYWNMLAPRRRPAHMAAQLRPLLDLSRRLHLADKAFFYSDFVIEEVV